MIVVGTTETLIAVAFAFFFGFNKKITGKLNIFYIVLGILLLISLRFT